MFDISLNGASDNDAVMSSTESPSKLPNDVSPTNIEMLNISSHSLFQKLFLKSILFTTLGYS